MQQRCQRQGAWDKDVSPLRRVVEARPQATQATQGPAEQAVTAHGSTRPSGVQ